MAQQAMAKRSTTWAVALFFLALTLLGLFTSADYGQPWDEPWEQDILRLNLNQYAAALGMEQRLAGRSDMPWPASGVIADSEERDHGECAYYPLFWLMADTNGTEMQRMTLWHAYTWLWFMAGAAALWCVCRRLGLSRMRSCVATLFLVLTPRMFAEGHYNNKDVVLLALTLLTLWQALRLMDRPSFGRAVLFSLAGAAAANTKVIGLMVWGLCALFVLVRQIGGRRMNARMGWIALTTLVSLLLFYALLTPALWRDPLEYLGYVLGNATGFSRWDNAVLFRGAIFQTSIQPLPRYYLPYLIAVTTPVWLLFFIGVGQVCAGVRIVKARRKLADNDVSMALLLCTLLWLLPMLYAVIARPNIYNGWRHFYFLYGPILALAAYGLRRAADVVQSFPKPHLRRIGAGLLALCMAVTGTLMALSHPNEFVYYNNLVLPHTLPTFLELDYWNVSTLQTLRQLLTRLPPDTRTTVTGADYFAHNGLVANWKMLTPQEQARLTVLPFGSRTAELVLANSTYAVLSDWNPKPGMAVIAETRGFGAPLTTVFTSPQP